MENRPLKADRYAIKSKDLETIRTVVGRMRHMTDVATHPMDMINFVHRCAGLIDGATVSAERIVDVSNRSLRSWQAPPPARDTAREITSAKGRRVRVVERLAGQLELVL